MGLLFLYVHNVHTAPTISRDEENSTKYHYIGRPLRRLHATTGRTINEYVYNYLHIPPLSPRFGHIIIYCVYDIMYFSKKRGTNRIVFIRRYTIW